MQPFICSWETNYLFISESVPPLLYYSHIPAMVIALTVGSFVFFGNKSDRRTSGFLFALLILFSVWSVTDLFLWSNNRTDLTMFWWTIQIFIELVIYALALLLTYSYIFKNLIKTRFYILLLLFLLPAAVLMPTNLYLFGITDYCVPEESSFIVYFSYLFEIFVILTIIATTVYSMTKKQSIHGSKLNVIFSFAVIIFLIAFTSGNIIGSITENWNVAQFGLFGMPIFIGILAYMIVKFNAFNVKLVAAQALVFGLIVIVGSMFFFAISPTNKILITVSLILVASGGYFLVKSVKKEIAQREQIEELVSSLDAANVRLKELDKMKSEFVSIASHQLRSPLTSIRGYASMLAEGTYGKLPAKATEILENIAGSSLFMAQSVEDYLNVSRIEAGNMKYELSDLNLKEQAEKVADEIRPVAMKKGLVLLFRSDCEGKTIIHADIGKIRQVIMNLIDNAMKYTPKGTITVIVQDDVKKKKVRAIIHDTGIGMDIETQGEVFDKFVRAKNANEINVTGTGLGLYVAKKMVDAMGGKIWAESEGTGKGSSFYIEFPAV